MNTPSRFEIVNDVLIRCKTTEQHVDIPDYVKAIDNWAFRGCASIVSVSVPDSVTSIGDSAFEGCSALKSIIIPASVTSSQSGKITEPTPTTPAEPTSGKLIEPTSGSLT